MKLLRIRIHWSMNFLFVMIEGIQVEKGLWTGRTGQPYLQMDLMHMSAYVCMGGGMSFAAALNLVFIDPFDTPTFKQRGAMLVGMAISKAWETVGEGASCAGIPPSVMGAEDSGSTFLGSWGLLGYTVAVGAWWCLLVGGWAIDVGEWDRAPLRSPTGLLPQILPLPSPPSEGLPFLDAELHPSTDWLGATSAGLEKEKGERGLSQRSGLATRLLKSSQKGQAIQSKKKYLV